MMDRPLRVLAVGLLACFVYGCNGGGSRRAVITHYPDWPYERYKTIGVVPFKSQVADAPDAGRRIASALEARLVANGTLRVYSRTELATIMTEQDLSRLADVADPRTAIQPGRIKAVQALIVGDCSQYERKADRQRKEIRLPVYSVPDPRGHRVPVGERVMTWWSHEHRARVAATFRIVDTATGEIVYSSPQPFVEAREESKRNSPPDASPDELAEQCCQAIAERMVRQIAVSRMEVKLSGKSLLTATEFYDNRWQQEDRFYRDDPKMFVAVCSLPEVCDQNPFRVAVVKKDERRELGGGEFVWSRSLGHRGQSFELVPAELLRAAGPGDFEAKLYSGPEPILWREFQVEDKPRKRG